MQIVIDAEFEPEATAPRSPGAQRIRTLLYIYIFMLLGEGIVRKWILPQISSVFLVVRDPVCLLAYILAIREGRPKLDFWLGTCAGLGLISFFAGLVGEESNFLVAAYGFRSNFCHWPIAFLMGEYLDRDDLEWIGSFLLKMAPWIAVLMMIQLGSPGTAFVNAGASEGAEQLSAALGRVRPSAIFSFCSGAAQWITLMSAFLIWGIFEIGKFGRMRVGIGVMSCALAMLASISRGCIISVLLVAAGVGPIVLREPGRLRKVLTLGLVCTPLIVVLLALPVTQDAIGVFAQRLENTSGDPENGSLTTRILAPARDAMEATENAPILGHGLGVGTNVGAMLIKQELTFLLAEDELSRVLLESGPVLGWAFLLWRILLTVTLALASYVALRDHDSIPGVLLFLVAAPLILLGQIAQSTTLGFTVVATGLCLLANRSAAESQEEEEPELELEVFRVEAEPPLRTYPAAQPGAGLLTYER